MPELKKLRGMILGSITGAMKSSPIAALGVMDNIKPLQFILKVQAAKASSRELNRPRIASTYRRETTGTLIGQLNQKV